MKGLNHSPLGGIAQVPDVTFMHRAKTWVQIQEPWNVTWCSNEVIGNKSVTSDHCVI